MDVQYVARDAKMHNELKRTYAEALLLCKTREPGKMKE
jgi:hypothetical protein